MVPRPRVMSRSTEPLPCVVRRRRLLLCGGCDRWPPPAPSAPVPPSCPTAAYGYHPIPCRCRASRPRAALCADPGCGPGTREPSNGGPAALRLRKFTSPVALAYVATPTFRRLSSMLLTSWQTARRPWACGEVRRFKGECGASCQSSGRGVGTRLPISNAPPGARAYSSRARSHFLRYDAARSSAAPGVAGVAVVAAAAAAVPAVAAAVGVLCPSCCSAALLAFSASRACCRIEESRPYIANIRHNSQIFVI